MSREPGGYILTKTAENELRTMLRFIAEQNGLQRALGVLEKFEAIFETLGGSPGIGFQAA